MLKVSKMINDKPVKIGNFKSYVDFANWCDNNPEQNIGTYYVIPSRCTTLASIDRVVYDGALCTADRRGAI